MKINEKMNQVISELDSVIHGKEDKIKLILATWVAGGHLLLEDLPGMGKTVLAKSLARVIETEYKRVQFTPDLLPSDITGGIIIDPQTREFNLRKGPLFSTIFLGDEINRATPRTQAALLESMAEKQITIDGTGHKLNPNFFVMATQNPVEQHGTFPLPEAQLDRFMVKLSLGAPDSKSEKRMLLNRNSDDPFESIKEVLSIEDFSKIRELVKEVKVADPVYDYVVNLVSKTREHDDLSMGASPRASLALIKLGQAVSLINGHSYLSPSTVYKIFPYVIGHRVLMSPEARFGGKSTADILKSILSSVKTPV